MMLQELFYLLTCNPTLTLVVDHVLGSGREFGIALNDLVDRIEEILLCHCLLGRN